MSKKFNCSMQKKIESLAKKSETKKSEANETELSKLVKAYCLATGGADAVPTKVEMVDKTTINDDGEVLIEFNFENEKGASGTTYALVFGDLYSNTDNDLLYFLHDWQSGEKVTPADVEEHDWELANDWIKPSEILNEKKSEGIEDQPEDVQKMVKELAEETGNNVEDAVVEDYAPGNGLCVTFGNEEYYCYADYSEAENASNEGVKGLLEEEGVSFIHFENIGGIEQFLDVDWFKDAQREDAEFYVSDIKESEPERYKEEFGDIDEEDAVEKCLADWGDDYIQWFKDNFGEKEFDTVIKENNLVDLDALAAAITEADGPANELASYDGEEIELPCGYYCYRHN